MSNQTSKDVRKTVQKAYAEAITRTSDSCCSTSCCGPSTEPIISQIGYSKTDLGSLSLEVAPTSFGCGNPLAFADVAKGQTVVDLGSGAGLDLLLAAEAVGLEGHVIGIDMTDAMIETARANIEKAGVQHVEVRKGIIEDLPVDDGQADWVISNCVINLSPEKHRVFAEIHRVLRSGGTMQVSDIVVEDLPEWARSRRDLFTACIGGAVSESEYIQGLEDAGLVDVAVTERLVYDADQIVAFLGSQELPVTADDRAALTPEAAATMARSLAGKVWSSKIRARKP
jgi:arsenite methyltransferase